MLSGFVVKSYGQDYQINCALVKRNYLGNIRGTDLSLGAISKGDNFEKHEMEN